MATSLRLNPGEATGIAGTRLALVLNEKAGALMADASIAATLRARLAAGGAGPAEPADGPLPGRVEQAARGADVVVVAGGDGTVACAAGVLAGGEVALGVVPCGTMNLLAKDLGLPIGDPDAASAVITAGRTRHIDLGQAGGHPFLCACMLGAPARLGRHREQARRHGWFWQWPRLARAALFVLWRPRHRRLVLTVDGERHELRTQSLTITLGEVNDAARHMFGRARLDSGLLAAYVVRRRGALDLLRVGWRLALGQQRDPALQVFSGHTMEVSSRARVLHVMVDGEVELLPAPVVFSVQPRALKVVAP
jgi:diacylglycerol kinase family enzyme